MKNTRHHRQETRRKAQGTRCKQGLVVVYTGNGKGKTSAAYGNVFRALGHGMKVLVVQFLKEVSRGGSRVACASGEYRSARSHKNLEIAGCGSGFVGICGDRKPLGVHQKAAEKAFGIASRKILSERYDLVVLDEINCAVAAGLLAADAVKKLIKLKPAGTHLILTGRGAKRGIIAAADLVTEMREIKHPYRKGIAAQRGIEY